MENNTRPLLQEIIQILKKGNTFSKEILSFAEACEYINLSSSFLYKMTSERKIPYFIPNGKMIFFRRIDLDDWLTKNRVGTAQEIQNEVDDTLSKK